MEATKVKSLWFLQLEAARAKNAPYVPTLYSTLNEKLGIATGETLALNEIPQTRFLTIGRGGHRNVVGTSGAGLTDYNEHRCTDACLFEHLPFIIREVGSDLTGIEREKYRMRRLENHNGTDYFVYYMKKMGVSATGSTTKKIKVVNGVSVANDDFIPSTQQLNPIPVALTNGVINRATGEHIVETDRIEETLDATDMVEILNAAEIIHGDRRYAHITEMALTSGFDKPLATTAGGVSLTYTESVASQMCVFIPCDYALILQTVDIGLVFNIGNSIPYVL